MVQEMIELNYTGRTRLHHGIFQALNQAISAFSSGKSHMDFLRRFKINSRGEIAYRSWYLRETSDHEGQLTYHGCCRPATHDGNICIAIFITKICKIYSSTSWRSEIYRSMSVDCLFLAHHFSAKSTLSAMACLYPNLGIEITGKESKLEQSRNTVISQPTFIY